MTKKAEQDMDRTDKGAPEPAGGVAADIAALTGRVRGPVFVPDDDGYDAERAGFQTARQHRPDVIVGATGSADVGAAVEFAGAHGLPVAVQGTGHALLSVAAEGGVLITTRRMTGVHVDAKARTAWLEAGVRWEQVIHKAAPYGLAPLSGSAPHVGAVGHRDAQYILIVLSPLDGFDIGTVGPVHQRLIEALAPWTTGRCLNYMYGEKATTDQVRTAYDPDDYRRLTELKAVYDPANIFRLNHNIPPATEGRTTTEQKETSDG
jgi:FAD/FMN-containing dehydrogenase